MRYASEWIGFCRSSLGIPCIITSLGSFLHLASCAALSVSHCHFDCSNSDWNQHCNHHDCHITDNATKDCLANGSWTGPTNYLECLCMVSWSPNSTDCQQYAYAYVYKSIAGQSASAWSVHVISVIVIIVIFLILIVIFLIVLVACVIIGIVIVL